MTFNRERFWRVFAVLTIIETCLLLAGCTAAWLNAVNGLLPSILATVNAVLSFVMALQGKTVSASTAGVVQKWQQNIALEITNLEGIVKEISANASSGLVSQFQAGMQTVVTELDSILAGLNITDTATVSKITQFVGLAVAAANAVLALIPTVYTKLEAGITHHEAARYDHITANAIKTSVNTMKETYVAIRSEITDNPEVNAALESLPTSI